MRFEYREPYFLASHFSLNFDGQAWQAVEPVYSSNQLGGRVTLRHQANSESFWSVALANEYQRSSITAEALADFTIRDELIALGLDPRDGQQHGTLSAISFDIGRNTTNNVLDARRGYVLNGHAEQAGKWLWGSFNYTAFTGEARHYLTVGRRFVVANGSASARSILRRPRDQRAVLQAVLRGRRHERAGWGRLEVSRSAASGADRRPLDARRIVGCGCHSSASRWRRLFDYGTSDQSVGLQPRRPACAAGPGLRYLTPVGPARIDFGYQLTPIDNLKVNGEPERCHWHPFQHRSGFLEFKCHWKPPLASSRRLHLHAGRGCGVHGGHRHEPPGSRNGCAASSSGRPRIT
jgi:hypothetical protein